MRCPAGTSAGCPLLALSFGFPLSQTSAMASLISLQNSGDRTSRCHDDQNNACIRTASYSLPRPFPCQESDSVNSLPPPVSGCLGFHCETQLAPAVTAPLLPLPRGSAFHAPKQNVGEEKLKQQLVSPQPVTFHRGYRQV